MQLEDEAYGTRPEAIDVFDAGQILAVDHDLAACGSVQGADHV